MQQIQTKKRVKPLEEDFRKVQKNDAGIGIMTHKDDTVETRQFNRREENHG